MTAQLVEPRNSPLQCSFCGRSEDEVVIVGGVAAFICEICVEVAMTAISEKTGGKTGPRVTIENEPASPESSISAPGPAGANMRNDQEIVERINDLENEDFFGFIRGDLVSYLDFDQAKQFLKAEATGEDWKVRPRDRDSIIGEIHEYMSFAWDKANNRRGLSAGRSLNHMQAWLWMIGEDLAAERIGNYSLYGKPQLRAICEHFGWDWRKWDDDRWSNDEENCGNKADEIEPLPLPWVA